MRLCGICPIRHTLSHLTTDCPRSINIRPAANAEVVPNSTLVGTLDGTGSSLVAMSYQVDGGVSYLIRVNPFTGRFDQTIHWPHRAWQPLDYCFRRICSREPSHNDTKCSVDGTSSFHDRIHDSSDRLGLRWNHARPRIFFSQPIDGSTSDASYLHATGPDSERNCRRGSCQRPMVRLPGYSLTIR